MLIDFSEIVGSKVENLRNGEGLAIVKKIIENGKTMMQITLPPKSSIGFHTHVEDEEIVYVIKGEGTGIEKNGEYHLKTGDVIYMKQTESHSIINTSSDDLVILGIIQK